MRLERRNAEDKSNNKQKMKRLKDIEIGRAAAVGDRERELHTYDDDDDERLSGRPYNVNNVRLGNYTGTAFCVSTSEKIAPRLECLALTILSKYRASYCAIS